MEGEWRSQGRDEWRSGQGGEKGVASLILKIILNHEATLRRKASGFVQLAHYF
jgi:hypothetical protein